MLKKYTPGEGLHLVKSPRAEQPPIFAVGANVPVSGIYRAVHGDHRLAHEVTLLGGQIFPRCRKCGSLVHFELVREASAAMAGQSFRISLYEIPHPEIAVSPLSPEQVA